MQSSSLGGQMLHIHFGAGRLGLGLIVPFFQTARSETFIANRAVSTAKPTGSTALEPRRRNDILGTGRNRAYVVQQSAEHGVRRHLVRYDGFFEYGEDDVEDMVRSLIHGSRQHRDGIIVTASVIVAASYGPVLRALHVLAGMRAQDATGAIFFVACENTLSAPEVFADPGFGDMISEEMRRHVTCVHALVDRVCIGLEEGREGPRPVVVAVTEEYGSLKLELRPETEALAKQLQGSRVEFTPHVAIEKQLKSWLLNGSHWLLALEAFEESRGDRELKLGQFLREKPEHLRFAEAVLAEMSEGIAVILRRKPEYAAFVRDVNPEDYLRGSAQAILKRFLSSDDPMSRILARFQAPTSEAPASIQAFAKRFADRVEDPITAYAENKGVPPLAAMRSVNSLVRLIASGTYINAA
jgi:mannitol-1-phosphate/altronate dehydrogenase